MKLIKAMKKLKFWSTKNKNKKYKNHYYKAHYHFQPPYHPPAPPPPPPPLPLAGAPCPCHFCQQPVEPSAPPLPPWLESQLSTTHEDISGPNRANPFSDPSSGSGSSYQQYLVENPVYEEPLLVPMTKKGATRSSRGLFGCGVNVGSFLIRCFCPCFHISDAP